MSDFDSTLAIRGDHDDGTVQQMWSCLGVGNVHRGVLCADGHKGYAQPVGAVIAYDGQISISGVGFDIACGNMAAKLRLKYSDLKDRMPQIVRDIDKHISFGIGRSYIGGKDIGRLDTPLFDDGELWRMADVEPLRPLAEAQLGTVGGGNHYVDIFRDAEDDRIWIGVHFGSRGLGHKSATRYLKLAGGSEGVDVPPTVVDEDSELGRRYIAAMTLAGQYAYAGREWVVKTICDRILKSGAPLETVHNHHNYAWRETHDGRALWVVRKGATPAFPGQKGFIGGSMGEDAVIVEGVDSPQSAALLYSTVHGAGRICSRTEAKGKIDRRTGEVLRPARFTRAQMDAWLRDKGVLLVGGDVDESPMAYRRLPEVLAAQGDTIRVTNRLIPVAVLMAGPQVHDPYKD